MADALIVTTYEDRPAAMQGVELLARSLTRHNPGLRLTVWSPLDRAAVTGLTADEVDWRLSPELAGLGWSVKPTILLRALDEAPRAMWIDSDVIVVGPIGAAIGGNETELVVGQEFRDSGHAGSIARVHAWGWTLARLLPFHLNSGTVVASRWHEGLLKIWQSLLTSDVYLDAQKIQPVTSRPVHVLGDQDVLWSLLCAEFWFIKLRFLRNGVDVVQDCGANGFHVLDRLRNLRSTRVMFVHALGKNKPWHFDDPAAAGIGYMRWATYEVSPYFSAAQAYARYLPRARWLVRRNPLAIALSAASGRGFARAGFSLAVVALATAVAAATSRRLRSLMRSADGGALRVAQPETSTEVPVIPALMDPRPWPGDRGAVLVEPLPADGTVEQRRRRARAA